ncbi:MAG TPA: lipid-A-disaccharide synthase [Bacteroidia bacterium]|nr:lipid-A-disaccharide synthase [Bacteroidia bacterium]
MKYYIIAGEASGDLHASNLMKELNQLDKDADFRAWGGELMQAQGAVLVKHYRDLAFMGFTEVVMNLRTILRNIENCKKDILEHRPDVLILVDYPGFNLRIAEFAKENSIKVFYYISPQVWAWKQSRVYKIKRTVDRMFVILPFEKEFYRKFDYPVDFVGHPLLDAIAEKQTAFASKAEFLNENNLSNLPIIALLPGSRKQEIETMLPLMLSVQDNFPGYQFVIAGAPSQPENFYNRILDRNKNKVIHNKTYELLFHSAAALVTSGTATLETALLKVPEVVCYKGGKISYYIARSLVKIKFISLVNLIMDKEVVKELIQQELNNKQITAELKKILNPLHKEHLMKQYAELSRILGGPGASLHTAKLMMNYLRGEV